MLYEELMFDESLLLRFNIFKYLTQTTRRVLAISQLSEDLKLNYPQITVEIKEIDRELAEIRHNHETIMMRAGKVNVENLNVTIDEYRNYLLQEAIPFQFILYFLNEEYPTIEQFCGKYFVSRSTVLRKLDKLKNYLKRFKIRFTFTESGMSGDERLIRLALFNLLWTGTHGMKCPLNVNQHQVRKIVDAYKDYFTCSRTYVGLKEMELLASISLIRIKKKKFVKHDQRYHLLMKTNSYYDFTPLHHLVDVTMTSHQLKGEISFIYYLTHCSSFYIMSDEQQMKQTIRDFSSHQNPVNEFVEEFRNFSKKSLFTDCPEIMDSPVVIANLLNLTFNYYVFRQPIPNISEIVATPNEKQTRGEYVLSQNIQNFMEMAKYKPKYSFVYSVYPIITQMFKQVLWPFFNPTPYSHKLKIGIAMEYDAVLIYELYHFLDDICFVDVEFYGVSMDDDYDLIISHSSLLKIEKPSARLYQLDFPYTEVDLSMLHLELQNIFTTKNMLEKGVADVFLDLF